MTQPQDQEYVAPAPPPSANPPTAQFTPPRRSFLSRMLGLVGWLATIILSVALALAAAAALLYFYFGFTLNTPAQIRQASSDVGALQSQNQSLQTEVALLQDAGAEQQGTVAGARERIDELEARVISYEQQAAELAAQASTAAALAQDLNENIAVAATIQAEGRENQILVAVVATVQADSAVRLADLQDRTDRIARFLQRLGDLAGDAASNNGTPVPSETPVPSATLLSETPPSITPPSAATTAPTPTP